MRIWVRQVAESLPRRGLQATVREALPHILWVETLYRLEKCLSEAELPVEARTAVKVVPHTGALELHWRGRDQVIRARGQVGLEHFDLRLARGDVLFLGYVDDELASFIWLKVPPVGRAGYKLADDESYMYDLLVFDDFRGLGIGTLMLWSVSDYARRSLPLVRKVVMHTSVWNHAALRAQEHAGYHITGRELSVVLLGLRRNWRLANRAV